ncbi:MAG: NADPH-dependent 7-cyano-7-deazaguanine reductase QueF [Nitrospirae bacterium]|nr:NADPH-dependent 7-cyano-7-deazaguanine reductase QueF [Nitrospirota bacterium]
MPGKPQESIEVFPNAHPDRDYVVRMDCPEFTSLCPKTGQPDFGRLIIEYVPDRRCIELKSLKLYLWSFRNKGIFYEDAVNRILKHLTVLSRPRWMRVTGRFNVRGGIGTDVTATQARKGFDVDRLVRAGTL